jgi:hypothetical protein
MSLLQNSNAISAGGYDINNSLRFRSSASAYLSRTPASATNKTTWTWSGWVKRGALSSTFGLFGAKQDSSNYFQLYFTSGDVISVASVSTSINTTQVFRDPSAWYHIVLAIDTTQDTAANRLKLYINGSQVTAFSTSTYPTQNSTYVINGTTAQHQIGQIVSSSSATTFPLDGYMAEVNFIDGQALTPSSFGNYNSTTGVWQPAKYTGTYGTNGFYLKFSNIALTSGSNTGLGQDFSGNGNYWNTNNISVTAGTTYDAMLDVPTLTSTTTANYCVMNPLSVVSPTTIANGNLDVTTGTTGGGGAFSTIAIPSSGKYYFEFLPTSATTVADNIRVGVSNSTVGSYVLYKSDGNKVVDGSTTSYGATFTTNDTIGCAIDVDGGTITFYKNNSSQGAITYATNSGNFFAYTQDGSGVVSVVASFNFGQRPFTYTPPTGFVRLNTYNLPTSTIVKGNKYMDATLYTGNGATLSVTNAGSFQPDAVWLKCRSTARNHNLFDSNRGTTKRLNPNLTDVEDTASGVTAFNSNGFTLGSNTVGNTNADTYVAWQWQAGQGSTSSNTSGSITSTVSVNATAGFSVVTYTGTGSTSTVGHGLGVAPKMFITKRRNTTGDWSIYNSNLGANKVIWLNQTTASTTDGSPGHWNNTAPTSSVFTVGTDTDVNASSSTYVAYCWAEIAGFSKAFSYTGNGSADGVFTYLGFLPKFILIKRTDSAGYNWYLWDTVRNTYNVLGEELSPNLSDAAATQTDLDITSNGFKIRASAARINASGGTYIGMAWASNPFKNSNAF